MDWMVQSVYICSNWPHLKVRQKRDVMDPTNGDALHIWTRAFLVLHSIVHKKGIGSSCIKNGKGKKGKIQTFSHLCTPGQCCKSQIVCFRKLERHHVLLDNQSSALKHTEALRLKFLVVRSLFLCGDDSSRSCFT